MGVVSTARAPFSYIWLSLTFTVQYLLPHVHRAEVQHDTSQTLPHVLAMSDYSIMVAVYKTNTIAVTLSVNLHNYTSFSHSSSFTISPTPINPSPFPDHQQINLLQPILKILELSPLHLTSCKQHTSTSLFLSSSQTNPSISIQPPVFHLQTGSTKRQSTECQALLYWLNNKNNA